MKTFLQVNSFYLPLLLEAKALSQQSLQPCICTWVAVTSRKTLAQSYSNRNVLKPAVTRLPDQDLLLPLYSCHMLSLYVTPSGALADDLIYRHLLQATVL